MEWDQCRETRIFLISQPLSVSSEINLVWFPSGLVRKSNRERERVSKREREKEVEGKRITWEKEREREREREMREKERESERKWGNK